MCVAGVAMLLLLTLTLTPSSPSYALAGVLIVPAVIIAEIITIALGRAKRTRGNISSPKP
jgi:hypothetical protein